MKSHLLLLSLAIFCSLLSGSLTGCAEGYYSPPVYYTPPPSIVPVIGWGGIGFYGGSYGNNGGYYRSNSSWGGNSGYWRH